MLTLYPSDGNYCEGGAVFLSISNIQDYTNPTYRWFKDGVDQNVHTSYYTATLNGDYFVLVEEGSCTAGSEAVPVRAGSGAIVKPVIESIHNGYEICEEGGEVVLRLTTAYGSSAVYTWFRNGIEIPNSNSVLCRATEAGHYHILVRDGQCTAVSEPKQVTRPGTGGSIPQPLLTSIPSNGEYCEGGNVHLFIRNVNQYQNPIFRWFRNGEELNSNTSYLIAHSDGEYFVVAVENDCTAGSETVRVRRGSGNISAPQMDIYPASREICGTYGNVTLRLSNANTYVNPVYQWYKDGTVINGANTVLYAATEEGIYYLQITTADGCEVASELISVTRNNAAIAEINLDVFPPDAVLRNNDPVEMSVMNDIDYTGATYYWFKGVDIVASGMDLKRYDAVAPGDYKLLIVDAQQCAVWSEEVNVRSSDCPEYVPVPVISVIPSSVNGQYPLCLPEGSVLFRVTNKDEYDMPAFQWFKNNSPIPGATSFYLNVTNEPSLGAGIYRLSVTDKGCIVYSGIYTVVNGSGSVSEQPQISAYPSGSQICGAQGSVLLRFTNADQFPGSSCQWYKDYEPVSGANSLLYEASEPGRYRLVVWEGNCSSVSEEVHVSLSSGTISRPVLTRIPDRNEICENGSLRLEVSNAHEYGNATYHWYRNNDIIQQGALPLFIADTAGHYFVQVTEGNCNSVSGGVRLEMSSLSVTPPVLAIYPENHIICGDEGVVVFSLTTLYPGGTLYQWYRNNSPIPGATQSNYSATDEGDYYLEVITDGCAASTIPVQVMRLPHSRIQKPLVSLDPEEMIMNDPVSLIFTNRTDYVNPQYHWFTDNKTTLLHSNSITYRATETGIYHLLVEDQGCARWSDDIEVRRSSCRIEKPVLHVIPSQNQICGSQSASILQLGNRSDYQNPVYQWYKDNQPVAGNSPAIEVTEAGSYFIKVSDNNCYDYSEPAMIQWVPGSIVKPVIERIPNGELCGTEGSIILSFTNAQDYTNPSYQWYRDYYAIDGADQLIYEVTEPGNYRIVVQEGACLAISAEEMINRIQGTIVKPEVAKTPDSEDICINGSIRLDVTNRNEYAYNSVYIWYKNDIPVQRSNVSTYFASSAGEYTVQVIDGDCAAVSDRIGLHSGNGFIHKPVVITYPPQSGGNHIACGENGVVVLRLNNSYAAGSSYQWYKDGIAIQNATGIIYSATESGSYYIEVRNQDCSSVSDPVDILHSSGSSIAVPDVSIEPDGGRIVEGLSAVLKLENSSAYTSPYYYWFRGDLNRFESTAAVVVQGNNEPELVTDIIGDYRLLIVEGNCASWSEIRQVTIDGVCHIADPVVTVVHDIREICGENGSVLLQVSNFNDYMAPAYQWYKDNSPISGQTRSTLELSVHDAGLYQVAVTDGCRKVSTPAVQVSVSSQNSTIKPLVERIPEGGNICGTAGSVILSFTNAADFPGATWQWFKDNYEIPNATGRIYEVTQPGRYRIVVKDGNCLAMSVEENISQQNGTIRRPLVSKMPNSNALCNNGNIRLSVNNTHEYSSNAQYVWYKGDEPVGQGADYIASEPGTYFVQVYEGTCSSISRREELHSSSTSVMIPEIVTYPSSVNSTICGDEGVVVIRLGNPIHFAGASFQWYRNGMAITGENDIMLSTHLPGTYYLYIILGECGVVSAPVTVTKNPGTLSIPEPLVSMFPQDGEIPSGGSVLLSFDNRNAYSNNAQYYWFRQSEIMSQNTLMYPAVQTGRYRLLVVDGDCARWSSVELDITTGCSAVKPELAVIPAGAENICLPNGSVLLQVSNRNVYLNPVYEWYKDNQVITGASEAALEVTMAGNYRVKVSEAGCKNYSDSKVINTVSAPGLRKPVVSRILSGEICGNEGSVMLRFSNSGDFPGAAYQWYKDNFAITGATDILYEATEEGKYRIAVTDGQCMALSDEEDIRLQSSSVIERPLLSKNPDNFEICINGIIRLEVSNADHFDNPVYIWYSGVNEVQRGSLPVYEADTAGHYFVQVIDINTCSSISERIVLAMGSTSITTPQITVYPESNTICAQNGVAVLRLSNSSDYAGVTYQWYKDGRIIPGATGILLSTTEAGNYYIEVRAQECRAVSETETITRNSSCTIEIPVIASTPADAQIIGGNPVELWLQNSASYSSGARYYWFRDGQTLVQENGGYTYTAGIIGQYRLLVVDNGKAAWSNEIEVRESICQTALPLLSVLPDNLDICSANGSVYMSLLNIQDFTSDARFQWYKNNNPIPNADHPYYNVTEAGYYQLKVIDMVNGENCLGVSAGYQIEENPLSSLEPLDIRMTPSSGILCQDGSVILYVYNRGAYENATYQWYKNGLLIENANGNTYEVTYHGQQESRAVYTAQVLVEGCGTVSAEELIIHKSASSAIKPEVLASGTKVCGEHGSVLLMFSNEDEFGPGTKYFQWFYNNELIAGATSSTYEAELGGNYRLQVVSGSCGAFSDVISLTGSGDEIPKPVILTSPSNGQICGNNGTVLLYLSNDAEYTDPVYQWYKDNRIIPGANDAVYEASERGSYRIQVSEGECSALSSQKGINTNNSDIETPLIETIPAATEICGANGVVTLRLTNAASYSNPSYIWYKDNRMIPGAVEALYHAREAGQYRIQVTEERCAVFSSTVTLDINQNFIEKPQLVLIPENGDLCGEGSVVSMSVSNTGHYSNATYIWFRNGDMVQNGPLSSFETSTEGIYSVQVVDGLCSSISDPKNVRITSGDFSRPLIASTTGEYNICGQNGTVVLYLTNENEYTAPVYQWYRDGMLVPDATSAVLLAESAGEYALQVTDAGCTGISSVREVTMDNSIVIRPVLSKYPDSEYICGEHGSVILSVSNSSEFQNPTYIWFRGTVIVQNSTHDTYVAYTEGDYYVQVWEGVCSSVSLPVHIETSSSPFLQPLIASTSGNYNICGNNGEITLWLTNAANYTHAAYQWYKDGIAIPNATQSVYHATLPGEYKLHVTEELCGGFSDNRTVTKDNSFIDKPLLSLSPSSGVITYGGSVTLTVTNHSVYHSPIYIWYRDNRMLEADGSPVYQATEAGIYYVEVIDATCSAISDPETLTRSQLATPQVSSLPAGNTICGNNGVVVLRLANAGDYIAPVYQWYRDNVSIPGATSIVYHATVAGSYKIQVLDQGDEAFSLSIPVTKNNGDIVKPLLATYPMGGQLCGEGSHVILSVSNTFEYGNANYIWYHGTEIIQTGINSSLVINEAGQYYVQVMEGGCAAISTITTIRNSGNTIAEAQVSAIPETQNICGNNGVVVLRLNNEQDYTHASYLWYKDNVPVPGATTIVYHATTAGDYRLQVTEDNCVSLSSVFTVTRNNGYIEKPELTLSPSGGEISQGGSVYMTVNNHSLYTNPVYIWYRETEIVQNGPSYNYEARIDGSYYVQVLEAGCSAVSDPEQLYYSGINIPRPLVASLPASNKICGNDGVVILRLTNVSDYQNPTFQWQKDGIAIPGATGMVYHAREGGSYRIQVIDRGGAGYSSIVPVQKTDGFISEPEIAKIPTRGYLCGEHSTVLMRVSNISEYVNATYVWYFNDRIVQNGPSHTYEATQEGSYYVQVIEGECSSVSQSHQVNSSSSEIPEPIVITTPFINTICGENGVVVLRMTNEEDFPNAIYQWYRYNEPIPGAITNMYVATIAGEYRIHVMENHCAAFSYPENITKNNDFIAKPTLAKTPSTGYICGEYGSVLLSVTNTADYTNPTYIWYRGNEIVQSGHLSTCRVTLADSYYVQVVDGGCSSLSEPEDAVPSSAEIAEPQVTALPSSQNICGQNGAVVLKLSNAGDYTNPVFQWYKDSIAIPRANSVIYHATEAGSYTIFVDDIICATFSVAIDITKDNGSIAKPVVTMSPSTGFICGDNGSVILSVSNSASYTNPTYFWYRGTEIMHEDVIPNYETDLPGEYYVQVVESGCSSVSLMQTVRTTSTHIHPAVISSMPQSNNICGSNGAVLLTLDNSTAYSNASFQWYRNDIAIPGANSVIHHATAAGDYKIQVVEDPCAVTSSVITITRDNSFITKPVLMADPANAILCGTGSTVTLRVNNHTAFQNATYVWYKGTEIVQTGNQYVYVADEEGDYEVFVMEGGCASVSIPLTIAPNPNPLPTALLSGNATILTGTSTPVTLQLTGRSPWIVEFTDGSTITVNSSPYVYSVTPLQDTVIGIRSVTDAYGCPNSVSTDIHIYVLREPALSMENEYQVCITAPVATITYIPQQTYSVDYRLTFSQQAQLAGFQNVSTAIPLPANSFDVNMPRNIQPGDYHATLTIIWGTYSRNYPFVIKVIPPHSILAQPVSQNDMCDESEVELSVNAEGINLAYQWYHNMNPIPGATSNRYVTLYDSDKAGDYHVVISSNCGAPLSSQVATVQPRALTIGLKWDDVLFVNNQHNQYTSYQWYLNGIEIHRDGIYQYYHNPQGLDGTYTVRAYYANGQYDESCPVTILVSKNMQVMVYPNPAEKNTQLTVRIDHPNPADIKAHLELYDIMGKQIYTTSLFQPETTLPVPMAAGTYMIRISTDEGDVFVRKVIVR